MILKSVVLFEAPHTRICFFEWFSARNSSQVVQQIWVIPTTVLQIVEKRNSVCQCVSEFGFSLSQKVLNCLNMLTFSCCLLEGPGCLVRILGYQDGAYMDD